MKQENMKVESFENSKGLCFTLKRAGDIALVFLPEREIKFTVGHVAEGGGEILNGNYFTELNLAVKEFLNRVCSEKNIVV